jgi:lipopolysaccharide/colanic/teichoic acid biosynthesis glycosyltransferase
MCSIVIKRLFDITGSVIALVLLAIPMLLVAVAIRLESRGPAIFRQRRAGRRGKPFTMLKFRTMHSDVEPYGGSPHSGRDPRLTRIGRFLRETSLDELPQLLNVLSDQMSLVGPRPLYQRQTEQWNEFQQRRLETKPGITGYAQAYGRAGLTIEDKIEMDVHYVNNCNFWLDLQIIVRTTVNMFVRRGTVYEQRYSRDREHESDT